MSLLSVGSLYVLWSLVESRVLSKSVLFSEDVVRLRDKVDLTVLMVKVRELLLSEPSTLKLPLVSENLELATEITPLVVLFAVGVKVAE